MEKLIDLFSPTTFSFYGYIVAIVCPIGGITFSAITGNLRDKERRNFHCNVVSKSSFDKNFLRASCFDQYDQQYNLPLPLYGFVLLSFFLLTLISIIYSWCWVKSRVEEVEQACKIDAENPRPRQTITTRRVFECYLTQIVIRLILSIVFIPLQNFVLYPSGFPTRFVCEMKLEISKVPESNMTFSNSSFIDCRNSMGSDKDVWAMIVWIVHMILACLVAGEIIYLIRRACRDKTFMNDSEFCQRHLFNRRKTPSRVDEYRMSQQTRIIKETQEYKPLIPPSPGEKKDSKNLDDMYVNLIIHTGRSRPNLDMERMDKLRILDEYVRPPENSIKINKLEELFLPNKDSSDPRKVLVVGCPGIGKTLLCKKLLRELSIKGDMLQNEARKYLHLFLFHFRNFNSEEMNSMSLQTLLSRGKYSEGKLDEEVFQFILEHPDKVLLVFDGLDESKDHQKCMEEEENHAGNGVADVMPFSALYVKLVKGKILKGATVLTTTRPYAIDSVEGLPFHRMVEILGFSTEKVKEYCSKFFHDDKKAMERVWQHVQSNLNLLYLCYIPVNCYIVCSLLEKIIELTKSSEDVTLPTTLTDIYQGALRLFIFKHHPEYQTKTLRKRDLTSDGTFCSSVEDTLLNLEVLAFKGIDERRLVFESEEVQEMENCGLLNRMPDVEHAPFTYKPQYCFIHLTMQEFVAARGISKMDPQKLQLFLSSKVEDEKWHLVIQFVAGLLKGNATDVNQIFVKNLQDTLLVSRHNSKALLMMKCLYEAKDTSSVKRAAAELKSNSRFTNHIKLNFLSLTPVDCSAIVYFVKHIDNLEYLDVSLNELGDGGCSEISKLIAAGGPQKLNLQGCNISDQGLITILETMKTAETCNLSQLVISSNNNITNKGYSYLCDALMDEKCKLTGLGMMNHVLGDEQSSLKLSKALKHENCNLTKLRINGFMLANHRKDEADEVDLFINFCNATLVDKNCKLRNLELEVDLMPRGCISHIWEVIKNENCRLSSLTLLYSYVRDEDIPYVCEALKHVNCTFTEFHLISSFSESSNYVTDEQISLGCTEVWKPKEFLLTGSESNVFEISGSIVCITGVIVSCLCEALKHKDCKLTRLSLAGSFHESLTSKSIEDLQDAITHDNCKLEELTLDFYTECFTHLVPVEYRKKEYTCSIKKRENGHKFLATRGRSGQYEEIDLSSIVFDEKKYVIIKIYRHSLSSSTSVTSACNIN